LADQRDGIDVRHDELKRRLDEAGAQFTTWQDAEVVDHFGDPDAEYRAIREGVAVADRSERETIVGTGSEVVPLLQGLVLGDVFKLAKEGSGQLNAAVNVKGRYITELRLLHVPDLLLIDFEPGMVASGALSHFKRQIINEDAKFHDRSDKSTKLLVAGPEAGKMLAETGEWAGRTPARLEAYGGTWGAIGGVEVIAQRLPTFGGDAWELLVQADRAHEVWDALATHATPVGNQALEVARIEAGIPRWGVELHEKIIPLEAGMSWMVAFDKGCYLGQEIIARLDTLGTPAKELRAIDLGAAEPPQPGTSITHDGKAVGDVIVAVKSPLADKTIVHAYVKRKHNEVGLEVDIDGQPGVVSAPGFVLEP
jgi:folate-binding protein YgfZ